MVDKPILSIIIPAYNERIGIKPVLKELKELSLKQDFEIIIVDDGSTDGTYDIVKAAELKIIRHPHNKGYGAAIKTGIRNSKADTILIMDADGQHSSADIQTLLKYTEEYDMVVGAREKGSHSPLLRRPWKIVLSIVANYLAGKKIPDLNSGFRAIKKERVLEFMHILPNGFSFSTTITLALLKAGYDVKYVAIRTLKRGGRKSNVNFFKDGLRTAMLIIKTVTLFDPLKVFLPMSLFLAGIGVAFSIHGILVYTKVPASGVIIILSSVTIFFVGILADQISELRRQLSSERSLNNSKYEK